jgi:hypothetical protein
MANEPQALSAVEQLSSLITEYERFRRDIWELLFKDDTGEAAKARTQRNAPTRYEILQAMRDRSDRLEQAKMFSDEQSKLVAQLRSQVKHVNTLLMEWRTVMLDGSQRLAPELILLRLNRPITHLLLENQQ